MLVRASSKLLKMSVRPSLETSRSSEPPTQETSRSPGSPAWRQEAPRRREVRSSRIRPSLETSWSTRLEPTAGMRIRCRPERLSRAKRHGFVRRASDEKNLTAVGGPSVALDARERRKRPLAPIALVNNELHPGPGMLESRDQRSVGGNAHEAIHKDRLLQGSADRVLQLLFASDGSNDRHFPSVRGPIRGEHVSEQLLRGIAPEGKLGERAHAERTAKADALLEDREIPVGGHGKDHRLLDSERSRFDRVRPDGEELRVLAVPGGAVYDGLTVGRETR